MNRRMRVRAAIALVGSLALAGAAFAAAQAPKPSTPPTDDSKATEQWERAVVAYRKTLQRILREKPAQSQAIAELSLHD